MDPMKEALMRRRGQGMQLQILLDGQPVLEGQADPKNSDLAPEAKMEEAPAEEGMEAGSEGPISEGKVENRGQEEPVELPELSGEQMQDLTARKPRSLGERARLMSLMSKSKK